VNVDEPITIEPYNPAWVTHFASERAVLCHALSIKPSRVEHIGSTSVVGMQTKPIVDIMLGLDSFPPLPRVSDRLHSLGYEALGEAGVPGRLYFRKRLPNAFNVQAVSFGGPLWKNNLLLRDFHGRVEGPGGATFERRKTDRRIVCAGGETQKGVLPFCRVASGIASVWRRIYRLRVLDERKADKCECD
jgi:hypothetical protein